MRAFGAITLAITLVLGCSSNDDSGNAHPGGSGGKAGTGGSKSTGGAGGSGASGGNASGGASGGAAGDSSSGGTAGSSASGGAAGSGAIGGTAGSSAGGSDTGGGAGVGGSAGSGAGGGGTSSGGSSSGGTGGTGGSGGNLNPDNVTPATTVIVTRDYETQNASEVKSVPTIAVGQWSSSSGYGSSGGWVFRPEPISSTAENEASAGWPMPWGGSTFPVDGYHLITVSFMFKISAALLNEIHIGGPFWAHVNKTFDFKYYNAAGDGEGSRNGIHFGESPPRFWFSTGGGGQFQAIGPDWRTLADQWVWVCFVVDMRSALASERTLAAYYKTAGNGVQLMGRVAENNSIAPLQPYGGRGFLGLLSPLFGYWDDMHGAATLAGSLSAMTVQIDRVRIANGWPVGANGPPN